MEEEWKIITGFPKYEISNLGNVRRIRFQRMIKQHLSIPRNSRGQQYYYVRLTRDKTQINRPIHRLMAIEFISNPNNLTNVDHIDKNALNNNLNN